MEHKKEDLSLNVSSSSRSGTSIQSSLTESDSEREDYFIEWMTKRKGHEVLCQIEEAYIRDEFNLDGLNIYVKHYKQAIYFILDLEILELNDGTLTKEEIKKDAIVLYGLIHARFIQTTKGMKLMYSKYLKGEFGTCPRVLCDRQTLVPMGESEEPQASKLKYFCPRCEEIYIPQSKPQREIDGASFGSSFAHMLCLNYGIGYNSTKICFIPRIHGFPVNEASLNHPLKLSFDYMTNKYDIKPRPQPKYLKEKNGAGNLPTSTNGANTENEVKLNDDKTIITKS